MFKTFKSDDVNLLSMRHFIFNNDIFNSMEDKDKNYKVLSNLSK